MWLYFDGGFVSIVEDQETGDLLVRARAKEDLERFIVMCDCQQNPRVRATPVNDYRYRVTMKRAEVVKGLTCAANLITYPNFKDQIAKKQGSERAHIYGQIWRESLQIDERRRGL